MNTDDILRAIAAVDWSQLDGVDGEPTSAVADLPALITGDDAARAVAYDALLGQLVEPWQWCPAGAVAAPILLDVARLPAHPARPRALMLLTDLLAGDHVVRLTTGVDLSRQDDEESYAEGPARAIYDAVVAAGDDLIRGVEDPDPRVRSATALLLAYVAELAPRASAAVEGAARQEREAWAQASLFLALGCLARYRGAPLSAAALEGWAVADAPVPRAFAWLAELYAEREPRELGDAELTEARREQLLGLLRAGAPPLELFPWSRGYVGRIAAWQLGDRGERALLFAAGAFAQAADEGGPLADRHAKEALSLCFESEPGRWLSADELDEGRRAVVAALSRREHPGVPFGAYGLPIGASERRRWLGLDGTSPLERTVELKDGRRVPLWQRLDELRQTGTPEAAASSRDAMLAEIAARLPGVERLEALALVAGGAHGLHGMVFDGDLYPVIRELGPAATGWARRAFPALAASPRPGAGGPGMACVWALTRDMQPGDVLPPEADGLIGFGPPVDVVRDVLERLPPERREAVVLRELRAAVESPWLGDRVLEPLLEVLDLCATDAVAEQALALADRVADDSLLVVTSPKDAEALRDRVRERLRALRPGG